MFHLVERTHGALRHSNRELYHHIPSNLSSFYGICVHIVIVRPNWITCYGTFEQLSSYVQKFNQWNRFWFYAQNIRRNCANWNDIPSSATSPTGMVHTHFNVVIFTAIWNAYTTLKLFHQTLDRVTDPQ